MKDKIFGVNLQSFVEIKSSKKNKAKNIFARDFVFANSHPFYKKELNQSKLQITSEFLLWSFKYEPTINFKKYLNEPIYFRIIIFLGFFCFILGKSFKLLLLQDLDSKALFLEKLMNIYFKLKFWWWLNLEIIISQTNTRLTIVNIVFDSKNKLLLAKRHNNWIPGDIGWAWFQGGLDNQDKDLKNHNFTFNNKKIKLTEFEKSLVCCGIRELCEETSLTKDDLAVFKKPFFSGWEIMSVSFRRFLYQGCKYYKQKKYLIFLKTEQKSKIKVNWENQKSGWFTINQALQELVPEKQQDLKRLIEIEPKII
jgi:8-oxo-dGTP pyrophosphatase MutT (NUDIX family)